METPAKKQKTCGDDFIMKKFIEWMDENSFVISPKVKITNDCVHRYGMVALEDIEKGEHLFSVPRSACLSEKTCSISKALSSDKNLNSQSGWVKLVLAVMYEYTNKSSFFHPYLDFVPSIECMDQPMFWNNSEKQQLKGTGVLEPISRDVTMIENEFHKIAVPFIESNAKLGFDSKIHDLNLYKHMVAFIMAYSFTEPSERDEEDNTPFMVPLADVLNHIAMHNAKLLYEKTCLKMISIKTINAGDEVYNTYGCSPNWQLLQEHGFVEKFPCNIYDTVDLSFDLFCEAFQKNDVSQSAEKIQWLTHTGGLEQGIPITLGINGVLSIQEFKLLVKIVPLLPEEFKTFCKDFTEEDWETDDSENSEVESEFEIYSLRQISKLDEKAKLIVREVIRCKLLQYDDNTIVDSATSTDDWRCTRARILVKGQTEILKRIQAALLV